ncbi:MAG TPA: hypothetical protein VHV30_07855, partial [Polyangiaceae bacterium]|nr:hypothetical protein [Polyangiaceae bacterium]
FGDHKGFVIAPVPDSSSTSPTTSTSIESATLTLSYVVASHLTLMLDNRIDIANSQIFASSSGPADMKTLFTTTLGAIIATK